MQRVLAVLVIGCLASSVVAQPTRTTAAGGIEALLPKAVVIDDHGEVVVESAWVLLAPGVTLESARLSTIPIESVVQGGARKPGVIVCNRSESETGRIEFRQPEVVRLSADGAYKAEYGTHFLGGGPSRFPAGWTDVLSTPRTCPVKYDASPLGALPVPRAPGFSIQWMFPDDTVGGPLFPPALGHPPAERYARVKDAIMRGGKYVARALQNSTGTMMVQVRFEAPSGATNASASCVPMVVNPSVSLLRNRLLVEIAGSTSGLEAKYEDLLTNELPPSSVPFVWDTTTRSATSLWVHAALAIHLQGIYGSGGGLPGTPPNTHAVVRVRPETGPDATTLRWQVYAAKCGATSTGTGYVRNMLDVTIAHEIIHGLGFLSSGDNLIEPTTAIEEWDAFRVPISLANATGGPGGNFRPAVRELRPGQQAVGIVSLNNAGWSQKLSQGTRIGGDTYQASHWKHKYLLPTGSSAIGIMDPVGEEFACEVSKTPRFFGANDLRALDILGWDLDPAANGNYSFPSYSLNNSSPSAGQVLASGANGTHPVFAWSDTGVPYSYSIHVFRGTEPDQDNGFYEVEELGGTLFVSDVWFPYGIYSFYVTADYDDGYMVSDTTVFVVACPADFNLSGGIETQDIFDFLNAWLAGDPRADFNQVDGLTTQDIFDYLNAWFAGCP